MELSEVRKVASLSRLAMSEQELLESGRQLTVILDYVRLLEQVDTGNVSPMTHPIPSENVFRDDEVCPSLPREAALSNAPKTDGQFFLVPKILDEKDT
ncbi:MAG: Asp-tRNA(Asn)/Glu-tRNA(Gln) amidotransferase subunit GatC [Planctomycetota bacterium]